LVLVFEFTHGGFNISIPMMAATVIATLLVRQIDGYSIYSARLPQREPARET
jgi:H+/Cl- antiporter ClcA